MSESRIASTVTTSASGEITVSSVAVLSRELASAHLDSLHSANSAQHSKDAFEYSASLPRGVGVEASQRQIGGQSFYQAYSQGKVDSPGSELGLTHSLRQADLNSPLEQQILPSAVKTFLKSASKIFIANASFIAQLVTNPSSAWDNYCKSIDGSFTELGNINPAINKSWNFAKKALGALKGISDSIGLTDIVAGAIALTTLPTRFIFEAYKLSFSTAAGLFNYANGRISREELTASVAQSFGKFAAECGGNIKEASRLFKGLGKLTLELTGLADVGRALYHGFVLGDWKSAALYAGFALLQVGALIWTIATLGTGVGLSIAVMTGRQTIKQAGVEMGKRCLTLVGKELGEGIAKEFLQTKGVWDSLVKSVVRAADDVAALIDTTKGLSLSTIEGISKEATHNQVKAALKETGLSDLVFKRTKEKLKSAIDNPKELAESLEPLFGKDASKKMVAEMRELLLSGKNADEVASALVKPISEAIYSRAALELEGHFAARLRANLLGEIGTDTSRSLAVKIEKEAIERGVSSKELAEQYVLKARKGFRDGLRQAIEEAVEAGVKRALKHLKRDMPMTSSSVADNKKEEKKTKRWDVPKDSAKQVSKKHEESMEDFSKKTTDESFHRKIYKDELRHINGKPFYAVLEQLDDGNWKLCGLRAAEDYLTSVDIHSKKKEIEAA